MTTIREILKEDKYDTWTLGENTQLAFVSDIDVAGDVMWVAQAIAECGPVVRATIEKILNASLSSIVDIVEEVQT